MLTLMLCSSSIVTNNIANKGSKYFNYGLLPLHSPGAIQDTKPKIFDTHLVLILGGSNIVTNNIAKKGGQYFNYAIMLLHRPCIMQDGRL